MPLSPVTVLTCDKGLVQSLVETGDDLLQVFTLLDYHLRLALRQSHWRSD